VLAIGLAACGGEETPPADTGTGDVVSIEEALTSPGGNRLTVEGYLIAPDGGEVRLCSAILESYPPQCGEPSLVVEGLDLSTVEGIVHTSEPDLAQVSWSETYVPVTGTIEDGVLTVDVPG
jgi:hypothetical protein